MIDESAARQHELECRVSTLEDEVEGEKRVSRHILQETRRNSDDLAAMKAQLMHLSGDMILANAALNSHGVRLNVLTQDVREIRTEIGKTRIEMSEIRVEMNQARTEVGEMRVEMNQARTEVGEMRVEMNRARTEMGEIRVEMNQARTEVGEIRVEMNRARTEVGEIRTEMNRRFDAVERSIATILAAVVPHAP